MKTIAERIWNYLPAYLRDDRQAIRALTNAVGEVIEEEVRKLEIRVEGNSKNIEYLSGLQTVSEAASGLGHVVSGVVKKDD